MANGRAEMALYEARPGAEHPIPKGPTQTESAICGLYRFPCVSTGGASSECNRPARKSEGFYPPPPESSTAVDTYAIALQSVACGAPGDRYWTQGSLDIPTP